MKYTLLLLFSVTIIFADAGNLSSTQLTGTWKMTDVKITKLGKTATAKTKTDCELCDLYIDKIGLTFGADGKVNYSNFGNPTEVKFELNGNIVSLYTMVNGVRNALDFSAVLTNETLTLSHISPQSVETYILTK